jgi:hypothetical protein
MQQKLLGGGLSSAAWGVFPHRLRKSLYSLIEWPRFKLTGAPLFGASSGATS